jgi:hypothetical protein
MGVLVRDGLVSIVPAPVRNRRQRADIAVLCHYLPHHILPFSDLSQTWAKPRKVNAVPFVSGENSPLNPVGKYVRVLEHNRRDNVQRDARLTCTRTYEGTGVAPFAGFQMRTSSYNRFDFSLFCKMQRAWPRSVGHCERNARYEWNIRDS